MLLDAGICIAKLRYSNRVSYPNLWFTVVIQNFDAHIKILRRKTSCNLL